MVLGGFGDGVGGLVELGAEVRARVLVVAPGALVPGRPVTWRKQFANVLVRGAGAPQ